LALRWITMFPEVTTAIPGAKTSAQAAENTHAIDLSPLSAATMQRVHAVYDTLIRPQVQQRW
jgi:aryl-alcohol dehydrogenase-like predicted oxidoreductase